MSSQIISGARPERRVSEETRLSLCRSRARKEKGRHACYNLAPQCRGVDPVDNADLLVAHFDLLDQSPDDFATRQPIRTLQAADHLLVKCRPREPAPATPRR